MNEYSTIEVAEACGATLRMLQNWNERGAVRPKYIGHRRCWSANDRREACIVAALRSKGITLPQIKKIMARVRTGVASRGLLLTDGKTTHIEYNDSVAIGILARHRGAMALVVIPALEQD
jgi:DNA-binding transcriptional MerR regulator